MAGMTVFVGGTAGNANINNNGAAVAAESGAEPAGTTLFQNSSTGADATINNNGGIVFGSAGKTIFADTSTAGNATISNNGGGIFFGQGGQTAFKDASTAGSSTLIAGPSAPPVGGGQIFIPGGFGGTILFTDSSTGGTSRVEVFGNGSIDISNHAAPGVTIGSLKGTGNAFLGGNNLTVGSNNLSTSFSGNAQDGGSGGGRGVR
jgi:hypothetical protein